MNKHKDYCGKCKITKVPLVKYCTKPTKDGGTISYYYCRPCNKKRYQSWYHCNPEKARQIIYRNNKKHTEKIAARVILCVFYYFYK